MRTRGGAARRIAFLGALLSVVLNLGACGGGSSGGTPPPTVKLQSISITPTPASIGAGFTTQLTATGTYTDSSTKDVTTQATWTSQTPSIATVGATTGTVNGVSAGSSSISATVGSVSASVQLSVVSGAFLSTGSMSSARAGFTATLLPSGKVLVVGGFNYQLPPTTPNIIGSAELYDPATGTWTATASLPAGVFDHTATLLPNGEVLIAGGQTSNAPVVPDGSTSHSITQAWLYDPTESTWTPTGSLNGPRSEHTATLLSNGTVLVDGGNNNTENGFNGGPVTTAEIYDPTTGTWSVTGSVPPEVSLATALAAGGATATLLADGTLLGAGGEIFQTVGTDTIQVSTAAANLFNLTLGTSAATGSLITPRYGHTATLLNNGAVLAVGGTDQTDQNQTTILASAELFDPPSGTWSSTGDLVTARTGHNAILLPNGSVLIVGGIGVGAADTNTLKSAEIYYPSLAN